MRTGGRRTDFLALEVLGLFHAAALAGEGRDSLFEQEMMEAHHRVVIGALVLEVTMETRPCQLMEAAHRGLRGALTPDWRGGVCCRVECG